MTDKIIFLDIDGPMIPYRVMFMPGQTVPMTVFDPVAVSFINRLCEAEGWKVVLHSSWIKIFGGANTLKHCISQGIKTEHFHADAYCDEDIHWRYTRVAKWLNQHPDVTTYAILDDEPYQDGLNDGVPYPDGMSLHMVLVNYYQGFLFHEYNEVLAQSKEALPEVLVGSAGESPMYNVLDDYK